MLHSCEKNILREIIKRLSKPNSVANKTAHKQTVSRK